MYATLEKRETVIPMTESKQRFGFEPIVMAVFFAIVVSCLAIFTCFNCGTVKRGVATLENRSLTVLEMPDFRSLSTLASFPKSFESFFADRFFFREEFNSARSYLRYHCFSIGSNSVLKGKDGWLFYAAGRGMEFIQNYPLFTDHELYWWCRLLEYKTAWCKARGIKFLFYAAPLASTIYPELLPNGIARNPCNSRLDQLTNELKKTSLVKNVDVRPALKSYKEFPIYLKTDTHWNSFGSFLATVPVVNALRDWFPTISPVGFDELHLEPQDFQGNLPSFMGIKGKFSELTMREKTTTERRWHAVNPEYDKLGGNYKRSFATEVDDPTLPTAVCIRDSFCISQREYLSNHFRRIVYEWENEWPEDLILKEKPDVVLQEKSEGTLVPIN